MLPAVSPYYARTQSPRLPVYGSSAARIPENVIGHATSVASARRLRLARERQAFGCLLRYGIHVSAFRPLDCNTGGPKPYFATEVCK